jgi:type IV secretion system protein VirB10
MQMQLTPVQQQAELIAAKERERLDDARFASNLVYSRSAEQPQQPPQQGQIVPAQYDHTERQANHSPLAPEVEGKQEETSAGYKRPLEANVDSATGQPYLIYEGSVLDTVLMNRLDGDAVGPVKVLVSNAQPTTAPSRSISCWRRRRSRTWHVTRRGIRRRR